MMDVELQDGEQYLLCLDDNRAVYDVGLYDGDCFLTHGHADVDIIQVKHIIPLELAKQAPQLRAELEAAQGENERLLAELERQKAATFKQWRRAELLENERALAAHPERPADTADYDGAGVA